MLNRREVLLSIGASVIVNTGLVTLFSKALPAAEVEENTVYTHADYGYDNMDTGICCYGYNEEGMSIHFKSTPKKYWYSREVFGDENYFEMIRRAEAKKGLNSLLNKLRSWPRPKKEK